MHGMKRAIILYNMEKWVQGKDDAVVHWTISPNIYVIIFEYVHVRYTEPFHSD